MIDQKKKEVLDDVETISIYKKERIISAVMILNHFVSFHITPDLLIYIKVTQPQPEDFFCPSRARRYSAVQKLPT